MKKQAEKFSALVLSFCIILLSISVFGIHGNANALDSENFKVIKNNPETFDWEGEETCVLDFSEAGEIPLNGEVNGKGLSLLTTESTGSTCASNLGEDGHLLLGYKARRNTNSFGEEYINGATYFRLNNKLKDKTSYAIRVEYFGGGNYTVNSGSYIDFCYNTSTKNNVKIRKTYGATYSSGKTEVMYFVVEDAVFSESMGNCKADFRLETWCGSGTTAGAQLKIKSVSVMGYEPFEIPEMNELNEPPEGVVNPVYSVDFSEYSSLPLSGTVKGEGLTLVTSISTGNTRASNKVEDGYLLLGKKARTNDNGADMAAKPEVNGAIYIKLDESLEEKAETSYAVRIDYFGGGISVDKASFIDLCYNSVNSANTKSRKTYGSTYNSGKDESMYFLLSDADFCEKTYNNISGADFRLETWCGNGDTTGAQLKIRKISVVEYDSSILVEDPESLFKENQQSSAWFDVENRNYYGLKYDGSAPFVKIMDSKGEHYALQSVDYFNIKITDSFVKAASGVTLVIKYWDIGRNSFSVEYNSEIPSELPPDTGENFYNYYSTASFEMYDTKELLTLEIPLENADFAGRQSGGNDLRIRTLYISDFYIESITLKTGVRNIEAIKPVEFPETTELNNFEAKTIVGYQAWFQASEKQNSGWKHWAAGSSAPKRGQQTFDVYPDTSDFSKDVLYQTGYSPLLNGNNAVLYDGVTNDVIDTQVKWMKDYGIDGFAVSRFFTATAPVEITGTNKLDYMKLAAEKYGRIFYMGYDLSGIGGYGEAGVKRLQADFVLNVEKKFVVSPNYAQIEGKPVVSLWGFQGSQFNRYPDAENALSLIKWFQNRGYYVIGGCPDNDWAKDTTDYKAVYEALDMISPWTVGRYNTYNAESYLTKKYIQDSNWIEEFNKNNPDTPKSYLPTIYPGFSWANWASSATPNAVPRLAGDFMWSQAKVTKEFGFQSSFIAMFDEFDEGTSIAKMAEDSMSIPSDQYFVTGAADGQWVSSDYYLRLTAAVSQMLCGERELTEEIPISYSEGPVFWRNSFEKRNLTYQYNGNSVTELLNIDVCVKNGEVTESNAVTVNVSDIVNTTEYAKTGEYAFALKGTAHFSGAVYRYKIADTKIKLKDNMCISYYLSDVNANGKVFVDLVLENGERLSELQGNFNSVITKKGSSNINLPISSKYIGRTVVAVEIAYNALSAGSIEAYVDDIVLAFSEYKLADIDRNGSTDSADLTVLKKYLLNVVELSNADVNCDGLYDIRDMIALKKYFAGMEF